VFRAGVELLTVDATVVDRDGRQVTDLGPAEFVVEVDGDPRPVVSAEYVRLVEDRPPGAPRKATVRPPSPDDAFFSTNAGRLTPGRLILLIVDEGNIRAGQGRQMMRSAVKFVDALSPDDRLAMVAIPFGARVDFTTNHERIREVLLQTVGQAAPYKGRFYISLSEAIATVEHSDMNLREQLMLRECGGALLSVLEATRCEIEVEQEAGEVVSHQRQQTQNSLRGIRDVLRSLAALEGPKSVILISEGLVLDSLGGDVDDIAALAADVRASLDVMLLDVPPIDASERERPTTPREDRDRQVEGLESLAGLARGGLHRIITTGDNAFGRVLQSIEGYYLIAVEARPNDRDGRRHRINVRTNRRGVRVYSRRGFLAPTSPGATSPAEAVKRALGAPLTINELPMRIATWTYKEPGGSRVRLVFTTEVDRNPEQALEYTTGLIVVDRDNRAVVANIEPRTFSPSEADAGRAVYSGSVVLAAGTYLLRVAVADSDGRLGSVERKLDAWQMNTTGLTVGDLMLAPSGAEPPARAVAAIEPHVASGQLAAMMEIYSPNLQKLDGLQATLDVLAGENARPLTSVPMRIGAGSSPEVGVLIGMLNTTALPPGRYLARAVVSQGGKPQGHLVRPFRVVGAAASADTAAAVIPASLPPDLLSAMLATLPGVDGTELVEPSVMTAVLSAAERARPGAKAALAMARGGKLGPAALEALTSGDQVVAAFLRGLEFFAQGQLDRAAQQLQIAMQQAPGFAPARLYLGATLARARRHREGASLLQSITDETAAAAPVTRMAGLSWLHAGDARLAIAALEKTPADPVAARALALAYVASGRPGDALPLLARHLDQHPKDQDALLAAVYATYAMHAPRPRGETLAADSARAQAWARAYATQKGVHQGLVDAWIAYLKGPNP
jgi:VWFA-related protein